MQRVVIISPQSFKKVTSLRKKISPRRIPLYTSIQFSWILKRQNVFICKFAKCSSTMSDKAGRCEQEEPLMHKTSRHCRLFLSGDEADTSWASKYTPPLVAPENSKFRLQKILHPSPPLKIKILEYTVNFQHTSPISFYCSGIATWQILQQEMKQTQVSVQIYSTPLHTSHSSPLVISDSYWRCLNF